MEKQIALILVVILFLFFAIRPLAGACLFSPLERWLSGFARREIRVVAVCFFAALIFPLALLPWRGVPAPTVQDEFSYLLAADTFAHGRLANPPHPLWIYFDTVHVNQHPMVTSKYPPAQGGVLALGEILGHPWIGVLLSVAVMSAAIVWALQAWLPPTWAFLGGILALLHLGVSGYWVESYWGGAMAAIGGALALGSVARIASSWRAGDALLLGIGEALLANSRPFEGLVFSLPLFGYLLFSICSRRRPSFPVFFRRFILPFGAVMLLCGGFMLLYNQRGTGNAFLFPYTVNSRNYLASTPAFIWETPSAPQKYSNPQFNALYNGWARDSWQQGRPSDISKLPSLLWRNIRIFVGFFLWPVLCLPLLTALPVLLDRRVRLLVIQATVSFLGFLLVAWFQPHYAAPLTVTVIALLTQALRHLRKWELANRKVGVGLCRAVVLGTVLLSPFHMHRNSPLGSREAVAKQIARIPGNHLVIVRYSLRHDPLSDWVYNSADVDRARIVWAREIPGVDPAPLLTYFRGRHVWIVEADSPSPQPKPYDLQTGLEQTDRVSSQPFFPKAFR